MRAAALVAAIVSHEASVIAADRPVAHPATLSGLTVAVQARHFAPFRGVAQYGERQVWLAHLSGSGRSGTQTNPHLRQV